MSYPRQSSHIRSITSLSHSASNNHIKGVTPYQSQLSSPFQSQNDLPGFLPQISSSSQNLQIHSTKFNKSQLIDESYDNLNSSIVLQGVLKRKSKSFHNIHEKSQSNKTNDRISFNMNEQNSIDKIKIQDTKNLKNSSQIMSPKPKKTKSKIHSRNFSQVNISNVSTLNISQNNSKFSANDFSIMLNDIHQSKALKNAINKSYLSSSRNLNSSLLEQKNEEQYKNLDSDIQKMISIYNNAQNNIQNITEVNTKINNKVSYFEEDYAFSSRSINDCVNERDNNYSLKSQQRKEKFTVQKLQINLKQMDTMNLQYKKLLSEIMSDTKKQNLYLILNQIIETVEKHCNSTQFTIDNYCLFANVCKDIGDFNKSVSLLHHARLISSMNAMYDVKLQLYKRISQILSDSVYLKKMLRLAWKLRDQDSEIEVYDLIGKNLMQIGEVELSDFFHQKSMANDKEPINSPLRIAGEIGVKLKYGNQLPLDAHDYKSESEDDLDLKSFPKSKQDESVIRNESLSQKKQSYFALPKILTNYGKRYQSLGRLNVPSYLREDQEIKVSNRMSHLSQNRDLKNFYVYTYKNQNFWIKDGDYNQQQKYYILKKNNMQYRNNVNKLLKQLKPLLLKCINELKVYIKIENNDTNILNPLLLQQ